MKQIKCVVKDNLNVPNLLTLLRIIIIFPCIYFFLKEYYVAVAVCLFISALSDFFDGRIARKFNKQTKLGTMLDPIADKLTLIVVVTCISFEFPDIFPIVVLLFAKELLMIIGGIILLKNHILPASAKWYGKISTVLFYVSVVIIVGFEAFYGIKNIILTISLLSVTAIFMVYALIRYYIVFLNLLKNNEKKTTCKD